MDGWMPTIKTDAADDDDDDDGKDESGIRLPV